jgi:pSer/pThr/pTyr-binding forkhead associated (FHA) protein
MSTMSPQSGGADPLAPHSASTGELKELLATERLGEPFLAFRDQQEKLRLHLLVGGTDSHTLGRRPEMDLSIPWDSEISGLHAELECLGGEWTIVDDNLSTNGTYVNGERVSGRQRLRDGDRIRLGRTLIAYNAAQAPAALETVAAGNRPSLKELSDTQRRVLIALCRPYRDGGAFATPATNQQIADEVFLSVDAVKTHLRSLFGKFELNDLAQNQKRARLAECVFQLGLISQRDLD